MDLAYKPQKYLGFAIWLLQQCLDQSQKHLFRFFLWFISLKSKAKFKPNQITKQEKLTRREMTILLSQKATVQRGYSEGYQFYTSWKFQIFDLCNFHLELKSSIASMAGRMSPACVGLPSHARSRQLRVPRA
jgi:hypothetical protein